MSDNDLLSCTNSLATITVVINHRNIPWGPRCLQLDQDIKAQVCVHVILCELEYRMPYYQEGCNISGLTLPKVLIAFPCEKNQRETLGSRISSGTGLTGLADQTGPRWFSAPKCFSLVFLIRDSYEHLLVMSNHWCCIPLDSTASYTKVHIKWHTQHLRFYDLIKPNLFNQYLEVVNILNSVSMPAWASDFESSFI